MVNAIWQGFRVLLDHQLQAKVDIERWLANLTRESSDVRIQTRMTPQELGEQHKITIPMTSHLEFEIFDDLIQKKDSFRTKVVSWIFSSVEKLDTYIENWFFSGINNITFWKINFFPNLNFVTGFNTREGPRSQWGDF